jgi:hypothetical protein
VSIKRTFTTEGRGSPGPTREKLAKVVNFGDVPSYRQAPDGIMESAASSERSDSMEAFNTELWEAKFDNMQKQSDSNFQALMAQMDARFAVTDKQFEQLNMRFDYLEKGLPDKIKIAVSEELEKIRTKRGTWIGVWVTAAIALCIGVTQIIISLH